MSVPVTPPRRYTPFPSRSSLGAQRGGQPYTRPGTRRASQSTDRRRQRVVAWVQHDRSIVMRSPWARREGLRGLPGAGDAAHPQTRGSRGVQARRAWPAIQSEPVRELARPTGLSVSHLARVRRREEVPHAKWWAALRRGQSQESSRTPEGTAGSPADSAGVAIGIVACEPSDAPPGTMTLHPRRCATSAHWQPARCRW